MTMDWHEQRDFDSMRARLDTVDTAKRIAAAKVLSLALFTDILDCLPFSGEEARHDAPLVTILACSDGNGALSVKRAQVYFKAVKRGESEAEALRHACGEMIENPAAVLSVVQQRLDDNN